MYPPNRPRPQSPYQPSTQQRTSPRKRTSREAYFETDIERHDREVKAAEAAASPNQGISFGEGFEERRPNQAKKPEPAAKKTAPVAKEPAHSLLLLDTKKAREGILLSEILGPPKGRAYFQRKSFR